MPEWPFEEIGRGQAIIRCAEIASLEDDRNGLSRRLDADRQSFSGAAEFCPACHCEE